KTDLGAVHLIGLGYEPPRADIQTPHIGEVRHHAHHVRVVHFDVAGAHLDVAVLLARDRLGGFHAVLQTLVVLEKDQWALLCLPEFIHAGDNAEAVDDKDVGTQVGNAVRDVEIETIHHAYYKYER